jgi:hypothetical protein
VALHLAAVCALYAVAYLVGGGWANALPPDLRHAAAAPDRLPADPRVPDVVAGAIADEFPRWAQSSELAVSWQSR